MIELLIGIITATCQFPTNQQPYDCFEYYVNCVIVSDTMTESQIKNRVNICKKERKLDDER